MLSHKKRLFYGFDDYVFTDSIVKTYRSSPGFQDTLRMIFLTENLHHFTGIKSEGGHSGAKFPVSGYPADPFPPAPPDCR